MSSTIDWPTSDPFRPVTPYGFGVSTPKSGSAGFYTGDIESVGHLADRYTCSVTLPPCSGPEAAARSALLMRALSRGDLFRFAPPHQRSNNGTLRGSPTVASNVLAGARSVTLSNAGAGDNLLRGSDLVLTALAMGWSTFNATITANAVTDPNGGTTGWLLNRTATGNHFAYLTSAVPATEGRTVTFTVWVKAGTLTGNVTLRLRDGAGIGDVASVSITPTSTWTLYRLSGTFPSGSAPNAQLYVDPANDAGSAGDNLQLWFSEMRLASGVDVNCTAWGDFVAPPTGQIGGADQVRRASSSNAYTIWPYATTAHAGQTFTFSVWLRAGTFSGNVALLLRDGAGVTNIASTTIALTSTWQRASVTGTFGASPAANIWAYVDQTDGGSVGEMFERYGAMLQPGPSVSAYYPWPTAAGGDFISIGGNLLQVGYEGATGDTSGLITLPLVLPSAKAIASGSPATTRQYSGVWQIDTTDGIAFDFTAPVVQRGVTIPFRQRVV